jgi:hypothetical protein
MTGHSAYGGSRAAGEARNVNENQRQTRGRNNPTTFIGSRPEGLRRRKVLERLVPGGFEHGRADF